ncbi:tetratricopeptide repeat protein [Mesorhizobium sp. M0047]|uniref:tetratricopeptide repeat protein n=1 Tax=Mesorhizobium sp. M0047 TaxID=2956859 RepID=UPI00333807D0
MPLDRAAAARLYQLAAEKGLPAAQYRLGLGFIDGDLADLDVAAGEEWMRRAALAGNVEAAYRLGDRRVKGSPPDYADAATWYRRAANAGHQAAARALASLYLSGNGVARDVEEGARWPRVSAKGGNQEAQVDFANLVLAGAGEPDDRTSIVVWFEATASSGDMVAAFNLGLCFAEDVGAGMRKDEEQAARWVRRAAEGVADAQYAYARMLQDGRGVALAEMLLNGRGGACLPRLPRSGSSGQPLPGTPGLCLRSAHSTRTARVCRSTRWQRRNGSPPPPSGDMPMPN